MNNMQSITTFELLPNEIVIECFEYLDGRDIYWSFDFLNYRYYKLIQSIPLYFNFQHVPNFMFNKLCEKILIYPEMKNQICSLQLSNTERYYRIHSFLSLFSFEQFSRLRSLTLINLTKHNVKQIISILPLLSNLHYFCWTNRSNTIDQIWAALPISSIKTLSIPNILPLQILTFVGESMSIVNLTISACSIDQLYSFFKYLPKLKYLSVGKLYAFMSLPDTEQYLDDKHAAVHLKQFILSYSFVKFDGLEVLLKKTPNLRSLTICDSANHVGLLRTDACRWQNLITSSLPLLDRFNFRFTEYYRNKNEIINKFQQFQNDFWHQQHQWYTECQFEKNNATIFTTPYLSNKYTLTPFIKYSNTSMDIVNTFDNVTDLELYIETITVNCKYYFSNVKSLTLKSDGFEKEYNYFIQKPEVIRCLKMIVNLSKLNHFSFLSYNTFISSSFLLHLLKEAPQLSSLAILYEDLTLLYDNRILCKYLNKMITNLDVGYVPNTFLISNQIKKLCQIFSNLEQFRCNIGRWYHLSLILNQLLKLSKLKVFLIRSSCFCSCRSVHRWLRDHASKLNMMSFTVKHEYNQATYCEICEYAIDDDNYDDNENNDNCFHDSLLDYPISDFYDISDIIDDDDDDDDDYNNLYDDDDWYYDVDC